MSSRRVLPQTFSTAALSTLVTMGALLVGAASLPAAAKDIGPANPECDRFVKSTSEWTGCAARSARLPAAGQQAEASSDASLFYAGYWMAKTGRYAEALNHLNAIRIKDEKALTYIGFATRKSGDTSQALGFYAEALAKNPDYVVARAYLGDAYLTLGRLDLAKAELDQIERRCGRACEAHAELAAHIAAFEQAAKS